MGLLPSQSLASLFLASPQGQVSAFGWVYVRRRFETLLGNLKLTPDQIEDGDTKHRGVVATLNRAYWN